MHDEVFNYFRWLFRPTYGHYTDLSLVGLPHISSYVVLGSWSRGTSALEVEDNLLLLVLRVSLLTSRGLAALAHWSCLRLMRMQFYAVIH